MTQNTSWIVGTIIATVAIAILGLMIIQINDNLNRKSEYVKLTEKIAKMSEQPSCFVLPEDGNDAADKLSTYYDNGKQVTFLVESMDGLILCFVSDHQGEVTKVYK